MLTHQMSSEDRVIPELQAIVLAAGPGSRVTDLTNKKPKCVLPVANRPLVYYALKMLEKARFKDVLVVIPEANRKDVPEKITRHFPNLNLEYFTVAEHLGTADTIRQAKDRIKADVLIVSCDTITDYPLVKFINDYRIYNPTLACLVSPMHKPKLTVGKSKNKNSERDVICFSAEDPKKLVFLNSEADFEENVTFKKSMLKKCPSFSVNLDILDAHVYIIKKWVVELLVENKNISSLKGELIPLLIQKQFRNASSEILNLQKKLTPREMNDGLDHLDLGISLDEDKLTVECLAHMIHDGYCIRANNVTSFIEANKVITQSPAVWSLSNSKTKGVFESVVGSESVIGEGSTLTKSILGKRSNIGSKTKIIESVVMQDSVIEDGCIIENSIVCSKAIVRSNCVIKNCIIAHDFETISGGKFNNEIVGQQDQEYY